MERMKQGFKRLLNTPPETHEEMVAARLQRRLVRVLCGSIPCRQ